MDYKEKIIQALNNHNRYDEIIKFLNSYILLGYPLRDIANRCNNLPIYRIIHLLMEDNENSIFYQDAITKYFNSLLIDQDKCVIISDNHLGRLSRGENDSKSILENERGLYNAYLHAYKNNINNIVHLGDLIEGNSDPTQSRITSAKKQVEYLERFYKELPPIKTFLLYGNHDYNSVLYDGLDRNFYRCCPNIELIGLKISYVNFYGNIIKLRHECSQAKLIKTMKLPFHALELSGHSHIYDYWDEEKFLRAPSLSCAPDYLYNIGFLEMSDEGDAFLIKFFDYNDKEVPENEKVIKKGLVFTNPSNSNNL